jgi:hypothetical protein
MNAIPDLLARVARLGGRVVMEAGELKLERPRDEGRREKIKELLPDLAAAKCGLLAHFRGLTEDMGPEFPDPYPAATDCGENEDAGEHCRECERSIWLGCGVTGRDVWRTCEQVMCPHFRDEYDAGGWRAEARRYEEWKRGKQG